MSSMDKFHILISQKMAINLEDIKYKMHYHQSSHNRQGIIDKNWLLHKLSRKMSFIILILKPLIEKMDRILKNLKAKQTQQNVILFK